VQLPTSLTRSTVTVLVPGIVALTPWLLALVQHTDATLGFKDYPTLAHAIFFAGIIVTGTLCEGLGSYIESRWDTEREEKFQVKENWFKYLGTVVEHEPVGYRYLSRLVTAMYFELAMLSAAPLFLLGVGLLAYLRFSQLHCLVVVATLLCIVGAIVFFAWQACITHRVICETRQEVMRRTP